jgi:LPXTG-motif cell wall-anchored protein
VTTSSAELPFTGLNSVWLLLGGLALIAIGAALRRFGSPHSGIR